VFCGVDLVVVAKVSVLFAFLASCVFSFLVLVLALPADGAVQRARGGLVFSDFAEKACAGVRGELPSSAGLATALAYLADLDGDFSPRALLARSSANLIVVLARRARKAGSYVWVETVRERAAYDATAAFPVFLALRNVLGVAGVAQFRAVSFTVRCADLNVCANVAVRDELVLGRSVFSHGAGGAWFSADFVDEARLARIARVAKQAGVFVW
jgi:hypothetical protein